MKRYRIQSFRRNYTFDTLQEAKDYAQKVFANSGAIVGITEEPEKTKVVFRMVRGSYPGATPECLALFPETPADNRGNVLSYAHYGQHGAASPDLSRTCSLATPAEYAPLKAELERIGYTLEVKTRSCPAYAKTRREARTR